MTNEQLDEIEKRWDGYLEKDEVERRFLFDQWWDKRDFWDMTKALREAWAALDQVSSDDRMSEGQIIAAITEAQKERDEVRAEVERLRSAITRFVAQYPWQDGPEIQELKLLVKEGK